MAEHQVSQQSAGAVEPRGAWTQAQEDRGEAAAAQSGEVGAAAGGYEAAREEHREDVKVLDDTLDAGLSEHSTKFGEAWPNAAAWLRAGKTKLVALTPTHDAEARAEKLGKGGKQAMFGIDTAVPGDSGYAADDQSDKSNIYCAKPTWGGFRRSSSPSLIAIIRPSKKSADSLKSVIVHEVQHDADHHPGSELGRYFSEFRAYWVDQGMARHSAKSGSADEGLKTKDGTTLTGFDNRRQQAIYKHLWDSGSYDYVKDIWEDEEDRAEALAMKTPTGTNLVNSPRIDDVYLALKGGKSVEQIVAASQALTVSDLKALAASDMRADWEALINERFSGPSRVRILSAVGMEPGAEGVQWAAIDKLYEALQGSKATEKQVIGLAGQLKDADRAILQRAEMKSEWIGLIEKRFEGEARSRVLAALGLGE